MTYGLQAHIIPTILHKTSDCFIFQMFIVQLFAIFLFKFQTKSKLFTWTLPKRRRHDILQ